MELDTRCPKCGTVFPASLEQLKLRKGYIRCVNCANIFDGFESVVEVDNEPRYVEPAMSSPDPEPDSEIDTDRFYVSPPEAVAPVREPRMGRLDLQASARAGAATTRTEPSVTPPVDPDPIPTIYVEPRDERSGRESSSDFLADRRHAGQSSRGILWLLFILLVLLGGAALLAYAYRVQVAAQWPFTRPWLERACVSLGCDVPYPQRIDRISIMNSSLQPVQSTQGDTASAAAKTQMRLSVVMRNTFDKDQQWPDLILDLVDFSGAVVSSRELKPAAYLSADEAQGPFRAGQEVRFSVLVDVTDVRVNGYQLRKLFPPKGTR